ncbi:hypothetical protein RO3G_06492 [Rhizopus delemar RA 99-880]|uniref:Uncharacterized protein n=1 Tax=Rhizopus delemar (strain RA 99-880 / ATCC MYA-4621 / FGSC 9543 / NRRL 43880) TaxID=246409 RepID=I1C007_RHIO9|nr:hypothetical protein RO3G_06492 [Rhizopus delemar RA 99-880]|eukprot:EIE81787.1 hypothetical protein RO3G_06492 [Rhizopus delemar RA 99-880]
MLPGLPRNFDNKVTDVSQLNLEADESEMIIDYTTSTTNNEETAEGNIDETEENDNTEQDEQRADIVECKKRLRKAYETILMYEAPLDDLDLFYLVEANKNKTKHRSSLASSSSCPHFITEEQPLEPIAKKLEEITKYVGEDNFHINNSELSVGTIIKLEVTRKNINYKDLTPSEIALVE